MDRKRNLFMLTGLLATIAGCPSMMSTGGRNFTASLTGAQETPAATTGGSGNGTFTLNASQTELTYQVSASGLTGPVTAAHFHRGATGVAGPIVFDIFSTVTQSGGQVTATGTWALSAADVTSLLAGEIYVNLHTGQFQGGEIRGQLVAQ